MRIHIDESNAADYFGRRLRVFAANDPRVVLAEGEFISFASAPTVMLEHDDGTRSSWQITLPIDEVPHRPLDLAKAAYRAYGWTTDFKNFRGEPMPAWDDLGDQIRAAWIAAASTVRDQVAGDTRPYLSGTEGGEDSE